MAADFYGGKNQMQQEVYVQALEELVCRAYHVKNTTICASYPGIPVSLYKNEYYDVAQAIAIAHESVIASLKSEKESKD